MLAKNQKKGRGQRGKKWISYRGNLFVSIFFSLEKVNISLRKLTITNTKLIINLLSKYYKKKIKIKLPNDILINNKKICGILQETIEKNGMKYIVVGIGLNLVKSPSIKNYPTTNLYELTKTKITVNKIFKELLIIYKNYFKYRKLA